MVGGGDGVRHDLVKALLARHPGEMQDDIHVFGDFQRRFALGKVHHDQLFIRLRFAHFHPVHQPHMAGQVLEATAQLAAKRAGGTGDQDAVEFGHVNLVYLKGWLWG